MRTTRGSLVCVGNLAIGSSGAPIFHREPMSSLGHDYRTSMSESMVRRGLPEHHGGYAGLREVHDTGAGAKREVLWEMVCLKA